MCLGRRIDDGKFLGGFLGVLAPRRTQGSIARQFLAQDGNARVFVEAEIVVVYARLRQQFADHAFMHCAVLAHVERGEMEAEGAHAADQPTQRALRGQRLPTERRQRAGHGTQVALKFRRVGIWFARADRRPRRGLADQLHVSRGQPVIEADNGAAIGLVLPVGRRIAARLG